MEKIKMKTKKEITFEDGCNEYIQNCRARNLREGTIKHYMDSMKQIVKYIDRDMLIKDINQGTVDQFVLLLKENPNIRDISLHTYARDLKTLLYFFMKREYLSEFKIQIPKADKAPIETYSDWELKILLKNQI